MSRISKDLAGQIAYKLTDASRKKSEALHVEYRELVTELYEAQIPKEVSECLQKNKEWFCLRLPIQFSGHGLSYERVSATRSVVSNNSQNDPTLHLTEKISSKITTAKRKYEKAVKDYKDLKAETEQALINLRTYKQIEEHIPAAKPFLPPPMSNALVCNFTSLNKKLEHQPKLSHVPELHPK